MRVVELGALAGAWRVFVSRNGRFLAADAGEHGRPRVVVVETDGGRLLWNGEGLLAGAPSDTGEVVYLVGQGLQYQVHSSAAAAPLFSIPLPTWGRSAEPDHLALSWSPGTLVVECKPPGPPRSWMAAYDLASGKQLWRWERQAPTELWEMARLEASPSVPAAAVLYYESRDAEGRPLPAVLSLIDLRSGRVTWSRAEAAVAGVCVRFSWSGRRLFFTHGWDLLLLDAATGAPILPPRTEIRGTLWDAAALDGSGEVLLLLDQSSRWLDAVLAEAYSLTALDLRSGQRRDIVPRQEGRGQPKAFALLPDQSTVVIAPPPAR